MAGFHIVLNHSLQTKVDSCIILNHNWIRHITAWSEVQTQLTRGDVKAVSELQCFKGGYGYGGTLVTSLSATKVIQPRQLPHFGEDEVSVAIATIWRIISQKYWEKMGRCSTKKLSTFIVPNQCLILSAHLPHVFNFILKLNTTVFTQLMEFPDIFGKWKKHQMGKAVLDPVLKLLVWREENRYIRQQAVTKSSK